MTSGCNYKGTIRSYALHKIRSGSEFGFLPQEYSKFKHGAENVARQYGYALAEYFIKDCFSARYAGEQVLVLSSAYSHIPTASFYMKNYFVDTLNAYLFDNGHPVTEETKIYRSVSYRDDYGEMSAEQRYDLIKGDTFYIDRNLTDGKLLIFIDDVKITGTHERIIVDMLNRYGFSNTCYMLYFAELADASIPPNIENFLNYAYVKSLDEVDAIIKNEQFRFNTRVTKLILNAREHAFDAFVGKQNICFIRDLYYNAIGNEYFKFPAYTRNLNRLKNIISLSKSYK